MAEAFSEERGRGGDLALTFAERFGLLVERQWSAREEGRLVRRTKAAQLKLQASLEEIDFRSPRGLDRAAFLELAELGFLRATGNLILTGATGLGKTYLACALADRALRRVTAPSTGGCRSCSSSSRWRAPTAATSKHWRSSPRSSC